MGVIDHLLVHPETLVNRDGLATVFQPSFEATLRTFLSKFEEVRVQQNVVIEDENTRAKLPFPLADSDKDWQWRLQSLDLVNQIFKAHPAETILEIGAWNGWLSRHLAKNAQLVVAADYFDHAQDGLRTIQNVANIIPLHTDTSIISETFLAEGFDFIVLNHCLAFFEDPAAYVESLVPLLKPNGRLIALGCTVYENAHRVSAKHERETEKFKQAFGFEKFIHPAKGFLDQKDKHRLQQFGATFKPYPKLWKQNVLATFLEYRPKYYLIEYVKG